MEIRSISDIPEICKAQALTAEQVKTQRAQFGVNDWAVTQKESFWHRLWLLLLEPTFLLLVITAGVYFILGDSRDGAVMLCFVGFMAAINLIQNGALIKH